MNSFKKATIYILLMAIASCSFAQFPNPDPYPYLPPAQVISNAQQISDDLEAYILQWSQGLVPSAIPASLIPQGITDCQNFYLKHPDSVSAQETWAVRYAKPINKDSLYAGIPDPRFTYLFLGTAFAPFGSKLIVEGEFPHARFFSMQISPPLNGEQYYSQRQYGAAEVSLVDVDIEPLPGHVNPFRVGADRNASNRSYKVAFDLVTGDPTTLNGNAFTYPYRENSNNRKGAMMVCQGPLGFKTILGTPINENYGDINLGCLWIRIYSPDDNTDALGGVPMPKVYFELPNGTKYFIGSDFSALQTRANTTSANRTIVSQPNPYFGPNFGWTKSFGITSGILNGIAQANGWYNQKQNIRDIELGWTGRGFNQPAPGNIEPHATTNNYISYVGRAITVPPGMVAVLTGKLPTFPATRNGESTMTAAQVRYWSIIGIDQDPFSPAPSTTVHAISDDEVQIDDNRNYVIAYSNANDRPNNAYSSNGVSWVDWGTQSYLGVLMRWACVAPDWYFSLAPHENNLSYTDTDWASPNYDSTLIGLNWRNGFMKCFLPKVHYMTKEEFESIGQNVNAENVPVWIDSSFATTGVAESKLGIASASSFLDSNQVNAAANLNDGIVNSAWSSAFGQALASATIDLGSVKIISAIKLYWDWIFFAKDYTIQVSNDNLNFSTIATAVNENGAIDLYKNLQNVTGRFIKLNLTNYNAGYYRLGEFEVYTTDCDCSAPVVNGITQTETSSQFILFPNPSTNTVTVKSDLKGTQTIFFYELQGRMMLEKTINNSNQTVDISKLPIGIYIAVLTNKEQKLVQRFAKM